MLLYCDQGYKTLAIQGRELSGHMMHIFYDNADKSKSIEACYFSWSNLLVKCISVASSFAATGGTAAQKHHACHSGVTALRVEIFV